MDMLIASAYCQVQFRMALGRLRAYLNHKDLVCNNGGFHGHDTVNKMDLISWEKAGEGSNPNPTRPVMITSRDQRKMIGGIIMDSKIKALEGTS